MLKKENMTWHHKLALALFSLTALWCVAAVYADAWKRARQETVPVVLVLDAEQLDYLAELEQAYRHGWRYGQ